jgi:hypothetical protein
MGSSKRRVIQVAKRIVPSPVELCAESNTEAQKLLDRSEHLSSYRSVGIDTLLCQLALDRFLFQWLGFESLAGEAQVDIPCPNCGHINSHSGSNRQKAYELYLTAAPDTSRQKFNREIWGSPSCKRGHDEPRGALSSLQTSRYGILRGSSRLARTSHAGMTGMFSQLSLAQKPIKR